MPQSLTSFHYYIPAPTDGALRSFVSVFLSFAPLWIWLNNAPLSLGFPEDLGGGPDCLGAGGGGGPGGGGGGGIFAVLLNFLPLQVSCIAWNKQEYQILISIAQVIKKQ